MRTYTGLCTKLQKRSQPGIRAILAVLRDEITLQYVREHGQPHIGPAVDLLFQVCVFFLVCCINQFTSIATFVSHLQTINSWACTQTQLLDVLVSCCLDNMVIAEPLGGERPTVLHTELHFRCKQMLRGRKWKGMQPLQLLAAKHIHSYAVRALGLCHVVYTCVMW